jgi:hypothetical protein
VLYWIENLIVVGLMACLLALVLILATLPMQQIGQVLQSVR